MSYVLGIYGASGRMGKEIQILAQDDKNFSSYLCYERGSYLLLFLEKVDVVIDFSSKEGTHEILKAAQKKPIPLVIGTTGLEITTEQLMKEISYHMPIVYSANFSLGIAGCMSIISQLASSLSSHFHFHIEETHHIHKKDSPSGTALCLAKESGQSPSIQSFREAEVIGTHRMIFSSKEETLELTHTALSRATFAKGALHAAHLLRIKPSGLYSLKDLFSSF
jgi:4-hydroxy-tetrahydrodipicolinate reductase